MGSLGGPWGAASVDPTQIVCWNQPGPTSNAIIQPGAGADLKLYSDQGTVGLLLAAGANGDSLVQSHGTGNAGMVSSDGTDYVVMSTARLNVTRAGQQKMDGSDTTLNYLNAYITIWNVGNNDVRWTRDTVQDRGDSATPADGASANSPTYGLRIYNDPVGAPALESFDGTQQYVVLAGGGTADVDTEWKLTLRGVQAWGAIHDEGENACKFRLPLANHLTMPVTNGTIFCDSVTGVFYKGLGGAWVAF